MWRAGLVLIAMTGVARADDPPLLEPAGIVHAVGEALAHPDPKAAKGAGHVIAHIDKADLAVETKALRAAIATRHWKVLDEFTTDTLTVITVEGATGARASISIGAERGDIGLTDRPTRTRAPGPCVAIPQVVHEVQMTSSGVNDAGELFHGDNRWKLSTTRTFDVDGDGIIDAFVPVFPSKNTCPEEVSWRVYAMRGACGHDLGIVGPGWLVPDAMTMAIDASGFRPLVFESRHPTYGKGHIPNMVTTTTSFGIKRGRYTQLASKQQGGLCHHCAMWWCAAASP